MAKRTKGPVIHMLSIVDLSGMKSQVKQVVRKSELFWRYYQNFAPWITYRLFEKRPCSLVGNRIVTELKRDGIAITTVGEALGDTRLFEELAESVNMLNHAHANEIAQAREEKTFTNFKSYLIELLGRTPTLNPSDIFVRFAVQPEVLSIVNSYFGMYTRLRFFNVWRNFASEAGPRNSQLWHRDPEDRFIIKMFVYLSDVAGEEAGPLVYAPGTHGYGRVKVQPESCREVGTTARRSKDDQMEAVVPRDKWIRAIGPKGTLIFVDTRGYHKGGWARRGDRIVYNCLFTSQATVRGEFFSRESTMPMCTDRSTAFALGVN